MKHMKLTTECWLVDHCAGRNATSLVYWLLTCMGWSEGMTNVVDGRRSVAGELK